MADGPFIPDFSEEEPLEEEEVEAEEGPNRAFLIGAILLAAVFVIGLCVALYLILRGPSRQAAEQAAAIEATNNANMTAAAQTATAAQVALEATETSVTEVAEVTAVPQEVEPTATRTPVPTEEPTSILPPTQIIEEGTPTEEAVEATAEEVVAGATVTRGFPTPTRVVSGIGEATALPETGLSAETGLAGFGLAALVLVAVAVVARRLRMS
jgi:hypothetical protein